METPEIGRDSAKRRAQRWETEAQFFDQWAERSPEHIERTDAAVLERYRRPGRLFHKEYRFALLGDLTNRRVLDVGCGDGSNSVLLAELGARVTGIDISSKAIEIARKRAEVAGLATRCDFVCAPLETVRELDGPFDIVWGDAILHHVLADLAAVMAQLVSWTRPGGTLVFSEPVNLAAWLRKLRHMVPVHTEATPDERPLERPELDIIRFHLPDMQVQPFHLLGRLNRFVLQNHSYERSSAIRRLVAQGFSRLDSAAFRLPAVRNLAGYAVIYGHRPSAT